MKLLKNRILPGYILRLAVFLPVCFVLWYYLAEYLLVPVGWLASAGADLVASGKLESVAVSGKALALETNLQVPAPDGRTGYLLLEINPLVYCWNLPLLMAMTLAAGMGNHLVMRMLVAWLGLLPFQAWGVVFEFLKLTSLQFGPEISAQMGYGPFGRELIALGYQFGFLMLPVISASGIWIAMHRWFITKIIAEDRR